MAQDVIYSGEGSVCTWEKGEIDFLFWGEMSYRYQLGLAGPLCHLKAIREGRNEEPQG